MRVLILSDIHANLAALESVLSATKGRYDAIWCLGDVVGYGPRPNECVELIGEHATLCVMGNHDLAVLGKPGMDVEAFNPYAQQAVLWTRETLTKANMDYLASLPDKPVHPPTPMDLLLTHASPREPVSEYVMTPSIAMENFTVFPEGVCLIGHTHKPVIYRWRLHEELYTDAFDDFYGDATDLEGVSIAHPVATVDSLQPPIGQTVQIEYSAQLRLMINPGSVGQPRDNDVRAAYAILDIEAMTWRYERVPYPIELTQNQMRAAQLPKRLIDRLGFGW
ncbi:MAG: metallophosphoesterase family protein [Caldilineaceae bacterium]|nr:metallophosphoesterase family protein [Caldilineaceae bacterium]